MLVHRRKGLYLQVVHSSKVIEPDDDDKVVEFEKKSLV